MPEVNNFKRKRANRSSSIVNPDGNCTPSDSETDDEEHNRLYQRKIVRRQSISDDNGRAQIEDESSNSNLSADSRNQGNNQLLYAALRKIQELENELAELDEADYDSGHQDEEDDIDEGNGSETEENHEHRDEILNGQAEALGFAFCVKETFEYLAAQGITPDNPIVTSLRDRFLGQCNQVQFQ
ncbi:F-box/WD repeat-containing protein 7 [Sitodiplosis mosellana]|uniref:F-box/WD repeat-containing protein 7 n=1 Tax=Sitodiplosis mosellana TaxID=263140 RepID=UPI0024453283|nr:F-box/WD repeat-containing protein 7 [Sitodiplosis mosellana]